MPQNTFTTDPGAGQAGQLASSADHQLNSAFVDQAAGIAAGKAVVRSGTDPEQASLPDAAADITAEAFLGFAYLDPSLGSPTSYVDNEPMSYLEKGEIYAISEEAVTAGDQVFVRYSTGGTVGGALGDVRTDDDNDGAAHAAALPNAVFSKTTSAAGIAVVKFYR